MRRFLPLLALAQAFPTPPWERELASASLYPNNSPEIRRVQASSSGAVAHLRGVPCTCAASAASEPCATFEGLEEGEEKHFYCLWRGAGGEALAGPFAAKAEPLLLATGQLLGASVSVACAMPAWRNESEVAAVLGCEVPCRAPLELAGLLHFVKKAQGQEPLSHGTPVPYHGALGSNVQEVSAGSFWELAMNINPSDGHGSGAFGEGAVAAGQYSYWDADISYRRFEGAEPLHYDFKDKEVFAKAAYHIAIVRHEKGRCEAYKAWSFVDPGRSLLQRFREDMRSKATEGGPFLERLPPQLSFAEHDPIFWQAGQDLWFNFQYSNNFVRIAQDGQYMTPQASDRDATKGLGMDFQILAYNNVIQAGSSGNWWHDVANMELPSGPGTVPPLRADGYPAHRSAGTDHGKGTAGVNYWDGGSIHVGQFAIYISASELRPIAPPPQCTQL